MFNLFFSKPKLALEEEEEIVKKIKWAEKQCTAEIHVHLSGRIRKNPLTDATKVFKKLNLHRTEHRNGVLIYVVPIQKQFAIIGDIGIHNKVKDDFWKKVSDAMSFEFGLGSVSGGIIKGIEMAGEQLAIYFPAGNGSNKNELRDEISKS